MLGPVPGSVTGRAVLLIVDAEPDIAATLEEFLGQRLPNVDVESVTSVRDAEAFLGKRRVDAIVVDYPMPGAKGIEFLERVRRENPGLAIVLITAHASADVMTDAVNRAHVNGFFVKPLDEIGLVESLARLLHRPNARVDRIAWRPLFRQGGREPR